MEVKNLIQMSQYNGQSYPLIDKKHLEEFKNNGGIINVSKGGLIIGPSHKQGGIYLLSEWDTTRYCAYSTVEGWEYFLNEKASKKYEVELLDINSKFKGTEDGFEPYEIPDGINIIDATPIEFEGSMITKFIAVSGSLIVINRHSTKAYLNEINQLNKPL